MQFGIIAMDFQFTSCLLFVFIVVLHVFPLFHRFWTLDVKIGEDGKTSRGLAPDDGKDNISWHWIVTNNAQVISIMFAPQLWIHMYKTLLLVNPSLLIFMYAVWYNNQGLSFYKLSFISVYSSSPCVSLIPAIPFSETAI